jgi:protein-S-isoprenylcysteine O-methyltransferase Ste14
MLSPRTPRPAGVKGQLLLLATLALFVAALTQPLLAHNLVAGAVVIPEMAAPWLLRVPQEEATMRQRFGGGYEAYCVRVGRWGVRS